MIKEWFDHKSLSALIREPEKNSGRVFEDELGVYLRLDGVSVQEKQLYETAVDGNPVFETRQTANGEVVSITNLTRKPSRTTFSVRLDFSCGEDELLTGLGQHEYGTYDYHGKKEYLYQHNMIISLPFLLSDAGYGVLIEAECAMRFESEKGSFSFILEAADEFGLVIFRGADALDVVRQLYAFTGKTKLLPRWAYGYMQSKQHYHTADELVEVTERFRREGIGLDCIIQDWLTWKSGLWGEKIPDPERYPDVTALTKKLHEDKTKLLVSIWPNMAPGGENYREFQEAGLLLPNSNIYNAYEEEARKLYARQCERFWGKGNVDGWWCDSCEPFSEGDWDTEEKLPDEIRYQRVLAASACSIDETRSNSYALYHAQGVDENWRENHPGKRTVNLSRSGFTGIQKYGAMVWSGDQCAKWSVLKAQIAEGQKIAMSGLSHWNLDIGAFFVKNYMSVREDGNKVRRWFWNGDYNDGVKDPEYRELYIRWLQYGVFLPICRSHGDDTPREPWQFGEPGSMEYETIKSLIALRYHLLPYLYTAAAQTYFDGIPMIRSLLLSFPQDERAHRESESYMLGDAFLIHPVTKPLSEGGGRTQVYLPAGADWINLTGCLAELMDKPEERTEKLQLIPGGQMVTVDTPAERFPVFVRAGSVIPLAANTQSTQDQCRTADVLLVFPGADGVGEVYGDEGDGYGYEEGAYVRERLIWKDSGNVLLRQNIAGEAGTADAQAVRESLKAELERATVKCLSI